MAVVHQTQNTHDDNYSPQSPEPSELSSISTPPMNVSAFNSWETSYTSTDDNTFYTSDEPRRVYWDLSSDDDLGFSVPRNPSVASSPCTTPPPPRAQKRKMSLGMSFPKDGGVSQHVCEACGQTIPSTKDIPGPSKRKKNCAKLTSETIKLMTVFNKSCILIVCTHMGTYIYVPPLMHRNTNSLRRWHVVATCHPTLFQS